MNSLFYVVAGNNIPGIGKIMPEKQTVFAIKFGSFGQPMRSTADRLCSIVEQKFAACLATAWYQVLRQNSLLAIQGGRLKQTVGT
jgi:hypothetical protein